MSEPPYDPYRRPAPPQRQPYQDPYQQDPYQQGRRDPYQQGQGGHYDQGAPRPSYDAVPPHYQQRRPPQPPRPPQQAPRRQAPPPRETPSGGGFKLPGMGLLLSVIGAIVQIVSFTLLPWIAATGGNTDKTIKLYDLFKSLTRGEGGGAHTFGEWYVALFSYPTVILGILLAFAAVLESVAAKVLWAILALAGLAFLVVRYGVGPLAGIFGSKSAMHFSTVEIVVAVVALAAIVLVAFTLKTAIAMFRRIAGVILIVLSGVHLWAVTDLVKGTNLAELDWGAYGPSAGYLLIGIGALVGPRRLLPVG